MVLKKNPFNSSIIEVYKTCKVNRLLAEELIIEGCVFNAFGDFKQEFERIKKNEEERLEISKNKKEKNDITFNKVIKVLKIVFFPTTSIFIIFNWLSKFNDRLSDSGFYDSIGNFIKIIIFIVFGIILLFSFIKLIKFLWIMA